MSSPFDLYDLPTRVKEQADIEYQHFKKTHPHLSDEQLKSMALSASGVKGYIAMILYPEHHDTPHAP